MYYSWSELYKQAIDGGATTYEAEEYADIFSDEHTCNYPDYPDHWLE